MGAAPFVEEALRWLPDAADSDIAEEILPSHELLPVPCPPIANGHNGSEKRPVILVADDNADMRQYLVRLLAERYEVQAVPDGQAALSLVRERAPELVLSDVMMPNLDGFGLLRELRSDPETRTIPIILLSARAGEESRVEGMEHGADDYLIKPFSARELLARVQTHLEMARVRKQGEEALRRRTEQFETLLNEAPIGVYLVDGDFRLRSMNPTARKLLGTIPNLEDADFEKFIRSRWSAENAEEILNRFRHTLETGEAYFIRRNGAGSAAMARSTRRLNGRSAAFRFQKVVTEWSAISGTSPDRFRRVKRFWNPKNGCGSRPKRRNLESGICILRAVKCDGRTSVRTRSSAERTSKARFPSPSLKRRSVTLTICRHFEEAFTRTLRDRGSSLFPGPSLPWRWRLRLG